MCAPFRPLFEKGEEEEAGRGRRRGKDLVVDDNDNHTTMDDERFRLVSGLKTRPDSIAFARAREGVETKGYARASGDRCEFSSSIVSKMMMTMMMMMVTMRVLFVSTRRSNVPAGQTTTEDDDEIVFARGTF